MKISLWSLSFGFILLIVAGISASAQRAKIPADLEITLERTVCFGTCPDYTLKIKANRTVLFKGGQFTRTKGAAKSRISRSSLLALIKRFDHVDLMSFEDDYSQGGNCESYITDLPSEIISVTRNGKTKTVNHYFGCVDKAVNEKLIPLTELGSMIDHVTNSKRWVGK